MRIFSIFFHPNPTVTALGGAEKRFVETLKVLTKKGVDITVLEPKPSLLSRFGVRCEVVELSSSISTFIRGWLGIYVVWLLWTLRMCVRCLHIIRNRKYDVILAPNNTLPNLLAAFFVHLVSHLPLCVVVHHIDLLSPYGDSSFSTVQHVYRKIGYSKLISFLKTTAFFIILRLLRRCDACITVSVSTAKALIKNGISEKRVYVNGNGVDINYIDSFKFRGSKSYDGVFVGRISREKGIFDLVKAWQKIVSVKSDAKLLIIGSGPDIYELRRRVKMFDLKKNVVVKGYCSDREMYTLIKASKVFIFPSYFEGWGLAVAEALVCGLPVICYDIPALHEVFGECHSVFLVPVGEVESLAVSVLSVLEMTEIQQLAKASRAYAKRFNWKKVAARDLQIIESVLHLHARVIS